MSLEELYQEVLLDHARHPRGRAAIPDGEALADEENPVCGDRVRVRVRVEDGRVRGLEFDGKGCAICTASGSLLAEWADGRPASEVRAAIAAFASAMRGERPLDGFDGTDIPALEGVKRFPMRVKCATLAWHALDKALARAERRNG